MFDRGKRASLAIDLTDTEAWHLAQFLKRVTFAEFRSNAQDDDETYGMRDASAPVREALADAGYAPR